MKVLIIDDEPLVRRALGRLWAGRGHTVKDAEDGSKGLQAWKDFGPDLVFLDVLMPGLSGLQVLDSIADHKGTTKVVLMSAYTGDQSSSHSGVDLFLPKPFKDIESLVSQVEVLFNGSSKI